MHGKRLIALMLVLCLALGSASLSLADDSWICPNCGRENPERANFCGTCRTERPGRGVTQGPTCNAWVCSGCGEVCPDGDNFCMICGEDHKENDRLAMLVDEVKLSSVTYEPPAIYAYRDSFTVNNEKRSFDFTAPVTGSYHIWLDEANYGFMIYMSITDPLGKKLKYVYADPGDGMTVELTADRTYKVEMSQQRELGEFTACIGTPREIVAPGNDHQIFDSVSYGEQENRYALLAPRTGTYRFEITEAGYGMSLYIDLVNELGERVSYVYADSGDGMTVTLEAGRTYILRVHQNRSEGAYTLLLGYPNETLPFVGCTALGDSVYYTDQDNTYRLAADQAGTYALTLSKAEKGKTYKVSVYDELGYRLGYMYADQDDSFSVELEANTAYILHVEQDKGLGSYVLTVTH